MGLFDPWDTTLPEGGGQSQAQRLGGVFGLLGAGLSNMSWGKSNADLFTQFDRTQLMQEQQNVKRRQQQKYTDMIENLQKSGGNVEVIDKLKDAAAQADFRTQNREGSTAPPPAQVTKQIAKPPMLSPQEAAVYAAMDPNQGGAAIANRMAAQRNAGIAARKLSSSVVGDRLISKIGDNVVDIRQIPKTEHERIKAAAELQKIQLENQRLMGIEKSRQSIMQQGQPQAAQPAQPGGVLPNSPEAAVRAAQAVNVPETGMSFAPAVDAAKIMTQSGVPAAEQDMVINAAAKHGIDPRVAAGLFKTESNFGRKTTGGGAGAIGYGQVMPDTGKGIGYTPEQLADPATNIDASLGYLKSRIDARGGNVGLGLQDYHTGQGNVDKAMAGNAPAAFGKHSKAYVPSVMKNAGLGTQQMQETAAKVTGDETTSTAVATKPEKRTGEQHVAMANMTVGQIADISENAPWTQLELQTIQNADDPAKVAMEIRKARREQLEAQRAYSLNYIDKQRLQRVEKRQMSAEQWDRAGDMNTKYYRDTSKHHNAVFQAKRGLSADHTTQAGQAALLIALIKAQDEGAIREGEMAIQSSAIFDRDEIEVYNRLLGKAGQFTEAEMAGMKKQLTAMGKDSNDIILKKRGTVNERAKRWGIDKRDVYDESYTPFDPDKWTKATKLDTTDGADEDNGKDLLAAAEAERRAAATEARKAEQREQTRRHRTMYDR